LLMGRRARGAELAEIELVYRARLAELRRVASAITGSREVGCDAVQDAFALAVYRRSQFRGEGSLEGWLWQIVVHSARDTSRRASRRLLRGREAPPVERVAAIGDGDPAGVVHGLVAELPERQRLVLFLRYYADLDYGSIAEALEISPGTVGATLTQAREGLRALMTEVKR
jgi:RNA polymerase sigma factor (sigma-70 family)